MRAKFTVFLRIAAGQASFQTLVAVAIFVLFTIKYAFSLWMIAAVTFIYHGGSSLLEKSLVVKNRAPCVRCMEHRAWSIGKEILTCLVPQCEDGAILQDHFGKFVYNIPKARQLEEPLYRYLGEVDET